MFDQIRNSSDVFDVIEKIAAHSGKKDKAAILKSAMQNDLFSRVVFLSVDPSVRFGIGKRFDIERNGSNEDMNHDSFGILHDMAEGTLTGNACRAMLECHMARLNEKSFNLMWRIILKDLRAGFGATMINEAKKGFIGKPTYQRCSLPKHVQLNSWNWKDGIISQEKADGMFAKLNKDNAGEVSMFSRQDTPIPISAFPDVERDAKHFLNDTQTHGELLVVRDGVVLPREIGNGILNHVVEGGSFAENEYPIFEVWDQIQLSLVAPKVKIKHQYESRLKTLILQLSSMKTEHTPVIRLIETKVVYSIKEAYEHYVSKLRQKKEGTVIKKREAIWMDGDSKEQVKLKLEAPCELEVFGWNEGDGKNAKTFGSLKCRTSDGKLAVNVSGFTDDKRKEIFDDIDNWTDGKIITVIFNGIMEPSSPDKPYSLFLPRFLEERNDKTEADDLQRVYDQFENAIKKIEDMEG